MRSLSKLCLIAAVLLSFMVRTAGAKHSRDFGDEIAGTYLATVENDVLILQLGSDGTMTVIFAEQFLHLGVLGEDFSNTKGDWKRVARRRIVASSVDIAFDGPTLLGVASTRYAIAFDRRFREAVLECTGAIYPPGVSPFAQDADPVPGSEFECDPYILERLP